MARKAPSPAPVAHCISSAICYAMTLPLLTPALHQAATTWIESLERHAQTSGRTLDERERAMAAEVGVCHPERIRVLDIDSFPQPPDPQLRAAAQAVGLTIFSKPCRRQLPAAGTHSASPLPAQQLRSTS